MTGNTALDVFLALLIGVVIWRVSISLIRMLGTPPPEIDPDDVVEIDQDYKCTVCGAELTMRAVNVQDDAPPRHCREDMIPVWRPV
ncbi:MAG: hypothetical protein M3P87_02230 [Actinomycetota bacterium]|nr:hypothetical protein [Actinomycetota bacterium]